MSAPIKFEEIFKISTYSLRLNGAHPFYRKRTKLWLFKNFFFRFLTLTCCVLLINSVICHDIKSKNYPEAIKNGVMAIVAITVTFKHSVLLYHHGSIKQLINELNDDYEATIDGEEEDKEIILKYTKRGVKICLFWLVSASLTSFMFPIKATIEMIGLYIKGQFELIPMFDFTYPDIINQYKNYHSMYFMLFVVCFLFDMYSLSVYIGFDPLVPIFMLHTCGQLDLLSKRIMMIFSKNSSIQEINNELKSINIKLMKIYRFVKTVQKIFIILYEFNMKTTTFLLPFSVFEIMQSLREKKINFEFIFFFSGAVLHFYIPCYYSTLLIEKNESFRHAIYFCGWEKQSNIKIRKTILLMLTRTYMSLGIKTVFYPISLDTFAEMTRQAYGIYNIMNAAWG